MEYDPEKLPGMKKKTVLITGCSSGFGRALVPAFLDIGWKVTATLRHAKDRENLFSEEIRKYPGSLEILSLDVAREEDRKEMGRAFERRGEGLDVLVNNAGYGLFGALEDLTEAQLRAQMEVNFFGLVFLTQTLLPALRKTRGRVINISSVMGTFGFPLSLGYVSSKFALEGFSECLYYELKPHGVQVCLVEPGRHRTSFTPNMVWGEKSFEANSPYAPQTTLYNRARKDLTAQSVIPMEKVVRKVIQLTQAKSMPLRVPVGTDAWFVKIFQASLPEWMRTALLSMFYRRLLAKQAHPQ